MRMVRVAIDDLRILAIGALQKQGYTASESEEIAEVLLYADLRGNDQGVVKLIGPGLPKSGDACPITVPRRTSVSALVNGGRNAGILVLRRGTELAAEIASESNVAIVGTNNTSNSTGCLGFYARTLADRGLVSFIFAGSRPAVAPHGSYEALLGTNPIAIGLPSGTSAIVLDFATAAITWYSLVAAAAAGNEISEGLAYDDSGLATIDPARAMAGAIRTFGQSHKSSGLSIAIELLTGPMVRAVSEEFGSRESWGNLIIAFNPAILVPRELFMSGMSATLSRLRRAKRLPGFEEIALPGERGDRLAESNRQSGRVDVAAAVYEELAGSTRDGLNLLPTD